MMDWAEKFRDGKCENKNCVESNVGYSQNIIIIVVIEIISLKH